MTTHRSGSYEYNVICDVCGFKYKASELRQRWDGPMVCKADWETRNILDFYRQRDDTHKLPFVRTDNQIEKTWEPIFVNLTGSIETVTGTYIRSGVNTINFWVEITPVVNQTTTTLSAEVSLPFEVFNGGTLRVVDNAGRFLGKNDIPPGFTTAPLPNWTANGSIITISGTYGM